MYTVFLRNWWKKDEKGKLVPSMQERRTVLRRNIATIEEAREICREYNDNNDPGELGRKAEFTSDY